MLDYPPADAWTVWQKAEFARDLRASLADKEASIMATRSARALKTERLVMRKGTSFRCVHFLDAHQTSTKIM